MHAHLLGGTLPTGNGIPSKVVWSFLLKIQLTSKYSNPWGESTSEKRKRGLGVSEQKTKNLGLYEQPGLPHYTSIRGFCSVLTYKVEETMLFLADTQWCGEDRRVLECDLDSLKEKGRRNPGGLYGEIFLVVFVVVPVIFGSNVCCGWLGWSMKWDSFLLFPVQAGQRVRGKGP